MNKTGHVLMVTGLLLGLGQVAQAEALYAIDSDTLSATTLFEQVVQERTVVTVKPELSAMASGDVQVLNQCLWSIIIEPNAGSVRYAPGKMVCVGPQQEVLETVPQGEIAPFIDCSAACERIVVPGSLTVEMSLAQPLEFNLQPRNERQ